VKATQRRVIRLTAVAATAALVTTGCGGSEEKKAGQPGAPAGPKELAGQTLQVAAVWTGQEQQAFQKVLDDFSSKTGAQTTFTPAGDNITTFLDSKLSGGGVPDVAMLPQQGAIAQFVRKGALKPLDPAVEQKVTENFPAIWKDFASVNGKTYGVYFKATNKSTVWYRTQALDEAGVVPPKTWDEFVKAAQTISDSGTTPISLGGSDGWTLTDWFENVYLSQAGPQMYDKLSKHQIKWTDPTVVKALQTLGQLWSKPNHVVGGTTDDFTKSVTNVFGDAPKAAMVSAADYVAGVIKDETKAKVGEDAKFFPFPPQQGKPSVVGGGDVAVGFKQTPAVTKFLEYLATPEAAQVWASQGGFVSANKNLDPAVYPDEPTREMAKALVDAGDELRFDMSDLAPASFGGTKGVGEWKALQDFLNKPTDAAGAARKLEAEAAKAFKK
jgi:alpha-glucoside transport system substrate-binding protein